MKNLTQNLDLTTLHLGAGNHDSPEKGMCVMEAASMLTGGEFGDAPACVSPVIRAMGIALNDRLPDGLRQRLVPFVPLVVNTADERDDERRAMILDWLVREYLPLHYDLLPEMAEHAAKLRALPKIKTLADLEAAVSFLGEAQQTAASVRGSVWASVRGSVWASVWGSVWGSVQTAVCRASPKNETFIHDVLNPLGLKALESELALYERLCLLGKSNNLRGEHEFEPNFAEATK